MQKTCKVYFLTALLVLAVMHVNADAAVLFEEPFEDTAFASRGWYDLGNGGGVLSSDEARPGGSSTNSFECRYLLGENSCSGGWPSRHLFTATDSVYVSYYVKYSSNWQGSNVPYHPHEFLMLTNVNSSYWGPSTSNLTLYIEQNEGTPRLQITDALNIDQARIGDDLTSVTEQRGVSGCNGDSDGHGDGDCWFDGSIYRNEKVWLASGVYFQDSPGAYYKNDWHRIEVYYKLNSISGGIGVADGVVKYWYDGELLIDHSDVMMRTGQYPNMMFNQFLFTPWMAPPGGSPVEQVMWVDDLVVSTTKDSETPSPPTDLRTN